MLVSDNCNGIICSISFNLPRRSRGIVVPTAANNNPGNFANRPTEEVQAISAKSGHASSSSAETNPGNFTNRPTEEVQAIGAKGGQAAKDDDNIGAEKV